MTVHLLKLAVGIEDLAHLEQRQRVRLSQSKKADTGAVLSHITRHMPRRAGEILDGGSMYWVIKGVILARQPIIGLEKGTREDGASCCAIQLDTGLVRTEGKTFRAFQGWRYLSQTEAPADLRAGDDGGSGLPPAMAAELRELGLL